MCRRARGSDEYVGGAYKKFPDIPVEILDLIAEDDRVVMRNHSDGNGKGQRKPV